MGNTPPRMKKEIKTDGSLRKAASTPPSAAELLYASTRKKSLYWDRVHYFSKRSYMESLRESSTVYVGNLTFSTRSSNLKAVFSTLGPVKDIKIGLNRYTKSPCGFAFVEYFDREHALDAVAYLSGTKLDRRVIRVELDAGYKPYREFGRGTNGGQIRDDRREKVDPDRAYGFENQSFRWQASQNNTSEVKVLSTLSKKRRRDESGTGIIGRYPKNQRVAEEARDDEL